MNGWFKVAVILISLLAIALVLMRIGASAGSTVLLALILSAAIVGAILYGWRTVRSKA